jgi:hypothetical protein
MSGMGWGWSLLAAAVGIVILKHVFSDAYLDGGRPTEADEAALHARARAHAEASD